MANLLTDQTVTISFSLSGIVTWLIVGLIAGFIAALIVRGHGYGIVTNIVIGLIGAIVGGVLAEVFKIQPPAFLTGGISIQALSNVSSEATSGINIQYFAIFVAAIGAALVLLLLSFVFRRRWRP